MVVFALLTGCARPKEERSSAEPYLLVWAGDADRQHSDFLALIDADPRSASYGKVVKTYPVRSRGNEPQCLNTEPRADRRVFAGGLLTNRTFVFDLSQPLAGRLLRVAEAGRGRSLWAPHELVTLPNGHVVVACSDPAGFRGEPRELLGSPGGLLELDAGGQLVREVSAADPAARSLIIAPYGAAASPALGRLVTTNNAHGYTATTRGERMPGISVQVWRLDDLRLLGTVVLQAGPRGEENLGPLVPRFMHRRPFLYVNTEVGGALYVSNSIQTPEPAFRLAFDFGAGALAGGAAITPDDRFYVAALTGRNRLVTLDLADPLSPRPASAVRFDTVEAGGARAAGPRAIALGADGSRVAVSTYTMDVPGHRQDGGRRVYLVRLDPANGHLRMDEAFRDERRQTVGVDFNRTTWPHGETGPARPAGLLFVTPAPPAR
jgi:hypothetical protein